MSQTHVEEPARRTPVIAEADVVVVGGGTAGIGAALAAARQGARTVLVEQLPNLGGTMVAGGFAFHGFFNNYKLFPGVEKTQVVKGIPEMLLQRLVAAGGSFGHVETEIGGEIEPDIPTWDSAALHQVCFELMKEYGVRLFMRTWFADALVRDGVPYGILVESKGGRGAILGKEFVDCTGDADLAARAGASCLDELQVPNRRAVGLIFTLVGVDLRRALAFGMRNACIRRLVRINRDTPQEIVSVLWLDLVNLPCRQEEPKSRRVRHAIFTSTRNDYARTGVSMASTRRHLDPEEALATEMELRDKAYVMTAFLRRHIEGFENAGIISFAPLMGVRGSRVVQCEYEIAFEDVRNERGFPDEVGRYAWADIGNDTGSSEGQPRHGGSYGFPYRALLPRQVEHLLVAGRLITSEHRAHESTRNTVHCMMQGEAAGTAAALAVQQGVAPRRLDARLLQNTLLRNGAVLAKAPA
jgi:hypothetical protein